MSKLFCLLLGVFFVSASLAQTKPVVISGQQSDYAGRSIDLYELSDPIAGIKTTLAKLQINADGTFHTEIKLSEPTFCQATFDGWQAQIYLEPGKSYQLIFPPLHPVSEAEKRNPFFRAEVIPFGLKAAPDQDLNRMIQQFDQAYAGQENRLFNQIYKDKSQPAADSLRNNLNKLFPATNNPYFEGYKFYRLASVEYALHQGRNETFISDYFIKKVPNLQLPPCYRLFEQLFTNFFNTEGNAIRGEEFRKLVGQGNLTGIENYLSSQKGWSNQLSHLVILKSINDAFYQGQFSKSNLLGLLDQIAQSNWKASEKQTAADLKQKLTYLQPNSQAPEISFTGFDGKKHLLSEFAGKFVYLHFTSVANPICRQHLDFLKKNETSFPNQLQIINLLPESEQSKKELILQQNWPGQFNFISADDADKYRVKSFPTAYLITPDGKLKLAPALNPMDGFDRQFSGILKQQRIEEMRNQAK